MLRLFYRVCVCMLMGFVKGGSMCIIVYYCLPAGCPVPLSCERCYQVVAVVPLLLLELVLELLLQTLQTHAVTTGTLDTLYADTQGTHACVSQQGWRNVRLIMYM